MSLSGKTIAFSGTLSMKRAEAKTQAEAAGAKVASSVTNKVDILVAADDVAGKKVDDAIAKGVEIWSEDDFTSALSGGHTAPAASSPPPPKKKAKATAASSTSSSSSSDVSNPTSSVGIDGGLANMNAKLASSATFATHDGDNMDARLAQVDLSKNTDKYYVLQAFSDGPSSEKYYVYSHWGRTGTKGQTKLDGPLSREAADKAFEKLYKDKTGLDWSDRDVGGQALSGKYQHLSISTRSSQSDGTWEYYLTNDPFGKTDGWYAYDKTAGDEVEKLYLDHQDNPSMTVRFVHAESSGYTYKVDLDAGTQMNTTSGKCRPIRRKA